MKTIQKNYKYLILAFLSLFSICEYITLTIGNKYIVSLLLIAILSVLFFYYKKLYDKAKIKKLYKIFILVMSFIWVLGFSYNLTSTGNLFWGSFLNFGKSLFKIMGYYFFFKVLFYYFDIFMQKEYTKELPIVKWFSKHPFLYSFLFLSICYSIYLIFYYPGILNYDNANQIKEVMGLHTRYLDAINPISDSTLTNFNPIVHTLILGGLFKLGYILGNVNFGLFLYTIIQLIIVITIYSYIISYSFKKNISPRFALISLLILGIIPLFGFYSVTAVKDVIYSANLLLFMLCVYDLMQKEKYNFKDYLFLFLSSILVCLFRNNGIYLVILTIPFLLLKNKNFRILIVCLLVVFFYTGLNKILLPALGISGTSVREALSVPFQQTARDVILHESDYTKEDIQYIKAILDYDNFKNAYDEDLADPIKNKFNKDSDTQDLVNYFGVWFKHFWMHPVTYVDATINNITTFFYPFESDWKVYRKLNPKLPEAGFDYHYNNLDWGRKALYDYEKLFERAPLELILNMAIITWLSILTFLMLLKNKEYIYLIPNMISILFCVIGPANAYYRYIYPSLLIMVLFFPYIKNATEKK